MTILEFMKFNPTNNYISIRDRQNVEKYFGRSSEAPADLWHSIIIRIEPCIYDGEKIGYTYGSIPVIEVYI